MLARRAIYSEVCAKMKIAVEELVVDMFCWCGCTRDGREVPEAQMRPRSRFPKKVRTLLSVLNIVNCELLVRKFNTHLLQNH